MNKMVFLHPKILAVSLVILNFLLLFLLLDSYRQNISTNSDLALVINNPFNFYAAELNGQKIDNCAQIVVFEDISSAYKVVKLLRMHNIRPVIYETQNKTKQEYAFVLTNRDKLTETASILDSLEIRYRYFFSPIHGSGYLVIDENSRPVDTQEMLKTVDIQTVILENDNTLNSFQIQISAPYLAVFEKFRDEILLDIQKSLITTEYIQSLNNPCAKKQTKS